MKRRLKYEVSFESLIFSVITPFIYIDSKFKAISALSTLNGKVYKISADQPKDIIAMLDVLNDKVSTKEDIAHIEDILDVLAARTTHQEAEILGLKRANKTK